jgi:hypothetical protein
MNNKGENLKA